MSKKSKSRKSTTNRTNYSTKYETRNNAVSGVEEDSQAVSGNKNRVVRQDITSGENGITANGDLTMVDAGLVDMTEGVVRDALGGMRSVVETTLQRNSETVKNSVASVERAVIDANESDSEGLGKAALITAGVVGTAAVVAGVMKK